MVEIRKTNDTITVVTFEYDALGRRIEKVIGSSTTRFYYDDQRIALQTSVSSGGSETDEKYFVYGNYIDEVLIMGRYLSSTWYLYYYALDHLYSPTAVYGQTGTMVERYEYDTYGSMRMYTSTFTAKTSSLIYPTYTFTGREIDRIDNGLLVLMYYRARSYDLINGCHLTRYQRGIKPDDGYFISDFPQKQYLSSSNLYIFNLGNPILFTSINNDRYMPEFHANNILYEVSGQTHCDKKTGKVIVEIFNNTCSGVCTKEHENVHKNQLSTCCKRYKQCTERSDTTISQCNRVWDFWFETNVYHWECDAYKKSVSCANRELSRKGCGDKKKACDTCCQQLKDYKDSSVDSREANCGAASVKSKCPYGWWGKIENPYDRSSL